MVKPECFQCGKRVAWVGIVVNIIMVAIKITVGISAGSRACLADGLHSSSNIVTAFAIFISRKMTNKPVDEEHPYGYGKIEFIAAGAVSVFIVILTVVLMVTTLHHVIYNPVPPPHFLALFVAVISIATNEMMFRYFKCVGTQLRSQTIIANAWANRADCFSSLAVVLGVLGSRLGFHHLDPIAAFIVAAIIVKVSIDCIRESVAGLMDKNVPPEVMKSLKGVLSEVEEVERVEELRARLLGNKIWVDVELLVNASHSIEDCDEIRARVEQCLVKRVQHIGKVLVSFKAVPEL